jgi:hypothetical protein
VVVNGFVTPESVVPAQDDLIVSAGQASLVQMQIGQAASLRATFVPPTGNTLTPLSMVWDKITVANSGLPSGKKVFTGTSGVTLDATNLFPFVSAVGVYAGSCPDNDPSTWITNYFVAGGRGYAALQPGDALRPVNVEMATMQVQVGRQPVSPPTTPAVPSFTGASVRLIPFDNTCPGYTASATFAARTAAFNFNIAVPFGRYHVCASTTGRTSSTDSTTVIRKYTTTSSAVTGPPANPADPSFSPVTPPNRQNRTVLITTPTATSGPAC